MFNANDQVTIEKGFFSFKSFYQQFRVAERENPESNFIIHMRIGTSGKIDKVNCHPFVINAQLGMAHNGVFWEWTDMQSDYSDTILFVQGLVSTLPDGFTGNTGIKELLNSYCVGSKLAFLDHEGAYTIINEHSGEWNKGIWYSNSSYEGSVSKLYKSGDYSSYSNGYAWIPDNHKSYGFKSKVSERPWGGNASEDYTPGSDGTYIGNNSRIGNDTSVHLFKHECDWCNNKFKHEEITGTWYLNQHVKLCSDCYEISRTLEYQV